MKKILVGAFVAAVAAVSQASYLNWQVDASDYSNYYKGDSSTVQGFYLYAVQGTDSRNAQYVATGNTLGKAYSVDVSNFASGDYNFYVEIVNYSNEAVARSKIGGDNSSYASLAENCFISSGNLTDVPQAQVWHASSYGAAPEPTSALLMMMGVAFLGLKRRKA